MRAEAERHKAEAALAKQLQAAQQKRLDLTKALHKYTQQSADSTEHEAQLINLHTQLQAAANNLRADAAAHQSLRSGSINVGVGNEK